MTVRSEDVVVVREAPPAPVRRGRPHTVVSVLDLERLASDAWRAVEEKWLGGWLLRASSGFTRRANSVLPLGDCGVAVGEGVSFVERWYAARGLPSRFQLADAEEVLDALRLDLESRGYQAVAPTWVMTAAASDVGPPPEDAGAVTVSATLEPAWLEAYSRQRDVVPGVTEQLLTGSPRQLFLTASADSGAVAGVARMSVHPGWAGLQALWVDPARRGRGLGRTLLSSAATLARQRRMPSLVVQVEAGNAEAIRLYESAGFQRHHGYVYLQRPA